MQLFQYLLVTVIVCSIAYFNNSSTFKQDRLISNEDTPQVLILNTKVPRVNILVISLILSFYSYKLGIPQGMPDRANYAFSFLHRYPYYYGSLESLLNARTEPGFLLFNMLIGKITNEAKWIFCMATFITSIINLYVISKISNKYLSVITLTMISLYFFQGTYLIRQGMAVSFANLALIAYLEGKPKKYMLFSIVACTFHSTAVIMIPLYYIFKNFKSKRNYITIFLYFIMTLIFLNPILRIVLPRIPYIGQYIMIDNLGFANRAKSITSVLKGFPYYYITILALIKRRALKKKIDKADVYILSSILYSICWVLSYNMYWIFRLGWYFMLPTLVLVPVLFSIIRDKSERLIMGSIFILLTIVISYRQMAIILIQ